MSSADNAGLDPSRGLLAQLVCFRGDYYKWVHAPSTRPTYRLFDSDFLERFSRTPWWLVPLLWVPVAVVAFVAAQSPTCSALARQPSPSSAQAALQLMCAEDDDNASLSFGTAAAFAVLGLALWTLSEYLLHRFLFHLEVDTPAGHVFHFFMHGQHHKYPLDRDRLVFPPVPAVVLAGAIFSLLRLCAPRAPALAMLAGITVGYIHYDLTHFYLHFGKPQVRYMAQLKRAHMDHHFKNGERGYGISSALWDRIFGTS
eukprot:m.298116 g.298116  ORF g.298116 m.298116 type:complete len:257 (+) comp13787_c0_seq1:123-893(+)